MSCQLYVIPRKFVVELYLICCLLRNRAGRHHASCVFVVMKENSDFGAESSIFHYMLQLVTAYNPFCSLDVAISNSVFCVHTATSLGKRLICGAPTADARSSMMKWNRSGDKTDACRRPCLWASYRHICLLIFPLNNRLCHVSCIFKNVC